MSFITEDFLRLSALIDETDKEQPSADTLLDPGEQMLVFEIEDSIYGLRMIELNAVILTPPISQIPFLPNNFSQGFLLYNGGAVPVVNLQELLSFDRKASNEPSTRCIITVSEGLFSAIIPDRVIGIRAVVDTNHKKQLGQLLLSEGQISGSPIAILSAQQLVTAVAKRRV